MAVTTEEYASGSPPFSTTTDTAIEEESPSPTVGVANANSIAWSFATVPEGAVLP